MSGRSWPKDVQLSSPGLLIGVFAFVTTNIGSSPADSTKKGCGGVTGSDAATGVANSGPAFVASITKTANNGEFLITLQDGYRDVWYADAVMAGPAGGPNDGKRACVTLPSNTGAGNDSGVTFLVTTHNENTGAAEETTGRTVEVFVVLKNSGVGS